jgi:carbamoyltransferase
MYILGISAFYHDSAACLLKNGEIIAAAQEERFTRIKHDPSFPQNAIKYCLKEANIKSEKIDNIVFYEKPFLKFERLIETYLAFAPKGFVSFLKSIPLWIKEKLFQKIFIIKELNELFGKKTNWSERLLFSEHHLSHAASAYYPSPFKSAAVLSIDGVGEWTTTSLAIGIDGELNILKEIKFPHSIGLLYSSFTYYLGFKVNSGEYKVMGLAPYGEPCYADLIKEKLIKISDDGSFQIDMSYFNYATGMTMINDKFETLFGGPARTPESKLSERHMNLAASIQRVTEEIVIKISKDVARETGQKNLCLAGGVALNCVVNGVLLKEKIFENIWIQPAAGDAGGALGAALGVWYLHYKNKRSFSYKRDAMKGSFLGPEFSKNEIETELKACGAVYKKMLETELIDNVVNLLREQKIIGWMQGRMEFGPRALGGRSIIADPRSPKIQKQINLKVKYRESFRPFAPSILREHVSEWFELNTDSPYMLLVANIKKGKRIVASEERILFGFEKLQVPHSLVPAITHIDYSSRIQTVHKDTNPRYYSIISKFKEKTGCPILVNTSFNVRGEPIICTPKDAFSCFMGTDLDVLVVGDYLLLKEEQKEGPKKNYKKCYELD